MNVKINNVLYPATIAGRVADRGWDNRESKSITMTGDYALAAALFEDGMAWSIVSDPYEVPVLDENGEPVLDANNEIVTTMQTDEYDNSDYDIVGPITDNRNGTITIKMGKQTEVEDMRAALALLGYEE